VEDLVLCPIGYVENGLQERPSGGWASAISRVVVSEALSDALEGIEEFSHIVVIFWFHRAPPGGPLKVHPKGRGDLPLVGVLSTRSPQRPNRLGIQTVRLKKRQENILTVQGLDALDGTPVLDIKPFIAPVEGDLRLPQWARVLESEREGEP
jgi:tRNA-Thr(GGU) m(6)t(6)A37 methyltransferase TsaA